MEGSILDGGTLEPDIEEIIEKEGYYSWENFSENLIKRTFVGAARDTLQGSIDFTNYIGNKFFDERPLKSKVTSNSRTNLFWWFIFKRYNWICYTFFRYYQGCK